MSAEPRLARHDRARRPRIAVHVLDCRATAAHRGTARLDGPGRLLRRQRPDGVLPLHDAGVCARPPSLCHPDRTGLGDLRLDRGLVHLTLGWAGYDRVRFGGGQRLRRSAVGALEGDLGEAKSGQPAKPACPVRCWCAGLGSSCGPCRASPGRTPWGLPVPSRARPSDRRVRP